MQEAHTAVVRDGRGAQGPLLSQADGIDDLAVSRDLADAVPTVGRNAVAEPLASVPNGDDALGVAVPGNIVDATRNDVVLALGVDGLDGVPDADGTGDVSRGDVEAGGGEAGYGGAGGVAVVLFALRRVVDGAEEDGFAGLAST